MQRIWVFYDGCSVICHRANLALSKACILHHTMTTIPYHSASPRHRHRHARAGMAIVLATLLASCGQSLATRPEADGAALGKVGPPVVVLHFKDWRIERQGEGPVPAGDVTFRLINEADRRHEFVIVRLIPEQTHPSIVGGRLDEDQFQEEQRVTEIDEIPPHGEVSTRLHLPPGDYLIFCNIVERQGGRIINHFGNGMHMHLQVR